MKKIFIIILSIFVVLFFNVAAFSDEIVISVEESVYDNFKMWTKNKDLYTIDNFNTIYRNRGTVELILLHLALKSADEEVSIKLMPTTNRKREQYLVYQGVAHIAAQCMWEKNINPNDYMITSPVMKKGTCEKGIYALMKSRVRKDVKSVEDLRKFKAVVLKYKNPDLDTLKAMGIDKIEIVNNKDLLFASLYNKKNDFAVFNISENNNFNITHTIEIERKYRSGTVKIKRNVRLYPVKNIKIGLHGSLHYITTKKSKDSEKILNTLEKGIKTLKEKKFFIKAYTEARCMNYRAVSWKQIF